MRRLKGLKSIAELVRHDTVGEVCPDFPAQSRALLLCWHDVGIWHKDFAGFWLQHENQEFHLQLAFYIIRIGTNKRASILQVKHTAFIGNFFKEYLQVVAGMQVAPGRQKKKSQINNGKQTLSTTEYVSFTKAPHMKA